MVANLNKAKTAKRHTTIFFALSVSLIGPLAHSVGCQSVLFNRVTTVLAEHFETFVDSSFVTTCYHRKDELTQLRNPKSCSFRQGIQCYLCPSNYFTIFKVTNSKRVCHLFKYRWLLEGLLKWSVLQVQDMKMMFVFLQFFLFYY